MARKSKSCRCKRIACHCKHRNRPRDDSKMGNGWHVLRFHWELDYARSSSGQWLRRPFRSGHELFYANRPFVRSKIQIPTCTGERTCRFWRRQRPSQLRAWKGWKTGCTASADGHRQLQNTQRLCRTGHQVTSERSVGWLLHRKHPWNSWRISSPPSRSHKGRNVTRSSGSRFMHDAERLWSGCA